MRGEFVPGPTLFPLHWGSDRKTNQISAEKSYLVKVHDRWFAGGFSMQWYGWSFDGWINSAGIQLNTESGDDGSGSSVQEIYEIVE